MSAGLLPSATVRADCAGAGFRGRKGDKLGLTVEPAPGSKQPTTTPILALPLPV